ncbi:MAG: hypothetical protein E7316_10135 [Clostridiales bacterium]|nr:hypothetical protein [Clostridiales bacterium]
MLKWFVAILLLLLTPISFAEAEETIMIPPEELRETEGLPELMRLRNGDAVETPEDWAERREELLTLYSHYMYGYMPDSAGEKLSYTLGTEPVTGSTLLNITVEANGRSAGFSVLVTLPECPAPQDGYPFYLEYMPWHYQNWFTGEWVTEVSANCAYAASRGYAGINYDTAQVAKDNATYFGAFYTLYPYDKFNKSGENQTGTLMAWAWGVSKVIDALEQGAGMELNINPANSLVGGVSRFGKGVAVAGAYDRRIRVVIPSCSGAGGMAIYRTNNSGKTYDLTSLGGSAAWVNESRNEPFSNLTGGESYWFCSNFQRIASAECLPVDQHMLAALVAAPERHMIIVTGIESEGWNNTEGQCLAYVASQEAWDLLGCGGQNNMLIHLNGHAILPGDMQYILDYCDVHLYGRDPAGVESDLTQMKGNLFLKHNREVLDQYFLPYLSE